ncbi:sporulation integral membrane protein YtvI [Caldalkalibacillus mannanilyticus]|uniref:sporulation integral membrane protein YtvI n=1 Tax=Caldalkalibacillus mannanilyticus TaxID=1418 RepID=UPI00046A501E|nr:sporulation integral membrane protein YtvI [Caldalkalibacillus mannanilyticus]
MQKFLTLKKVLIALGIIAIGLLLYFYLSVFMPILLALFTAFLLEPLVQGTQKFLRLKNRLPSVVIVFSLFVFFIAISFYLAITKLVNEVIKFVYRLPYYAVELTYFVENTIADFNQAVANFPPVLIQEISKQSPKILNKGEEIAQSAIQLIANWAQAIPTLIVVTIIYLITLFLISMDLPKLREQFYNHFKEENAKKVRYMSHRLGYVFIGFFKAQFLVSIVIFIVSYIGLLLISPGNALIMALLLWLIDFIPFIGSIIILAPWALFNIISGDPSTGVKLLILAGVLLTLRRTLEPMIMGEQIGLSALSTLLSIYLGLYFLGVVGLVAGPLFLIAIKSAMEAGIIKTDFKL